MSKLANHSKTKEIIERYGFRLTKSLGQNFIVNQQILDQIVDSAEITKEDIIFEIGTGIGTLTYELAQRGKKVVAIEIDKTLIPILEETLTDCHNAYIINQDILKTDLNQLVDQYGENRPIKIVANLPYYITTPIIMNLLESNVAIDSFVVMIQKEVAQRIAAKPSTKEYGSLTVAIQYYGESKIIAKVPKSAFIPEPNVDSSVLQIKVNKNRNINVKDETLFFQVVKGSFSKRRKTILNSLSTYGNFSKSWIEPSLEEAGIDPKRRGETLTIDEFAALANAVWNQRTILGIGG